MTADDVKTALRSIRFARRHDAAVARTLLADLYRDVLVEVAAGSPGASVLAELALDGESLPFERAFTERAA